MPKKNKIIVKTILRSFEKKIIYSTIVYLKLNDNSNKKKRYSIWFLFKKFFFLFVNSTIFSNEIHQKNKKN